MQTVVRSTRERSVKVLSQKGFGEEVSFESLHDGRCITIRLKTRRLANPSRSVSRQPRKRKKNLQTKFFLDHLAIKNTVRFIGQ